LDTTLAVWVDGLQHPDLACRSVAVVRGDSLVGAVLHTEYSLSDGLIRIDELVERAVALGLPAVAVTDQSNLFAMVKLYKAARNRGVKPIIGAELCVSDDPASGQRRRLVALCQNDTGYRNLAGLLTRSYTDGQYQCLAHVHPQWLLDGGEGLILLSGGVHGEIGQWLAHDTPRNAERRLRPWLEAYPESAKVSRTFRRFHAHGLIAKIPRTRRWRVTLYGRRVMGTSLYLRDHDFPKAYSKIAA